MVYDKNENHFFGKAKKVILDNGIKVRHDLLPVNNILVDVWYIGKESLPKYNQDLRNLRIYLSKLHSYKESTRLVLNYLEHDKVFTLDMNKISNFLNYVLYRMEKDKHYGYSNKDFWRIAFYVDKIYNYASWAEFKIQIKGKLKGISMCSNKIVIKDSTLTNSPIVQDSPDTNVNNASDHALSTYLSNLDKILKEIIRENDITNEIQGILLKQTETFKEYVFNETPQKSFASKLFENIKTTLSFAIGNSDGIKKLIDCGNDILSILK